VTEHFKLQEFIFSNTASQLKIDNTPPDSVRGSLQFTAEGMERIKTKLQALRSVEAIPVKITSGYRSPELNKRIGGVVTSQHVKGEACDFIAPLFGTPKEIVKALSEHVEELGIDQIIAEGTWVHVSFSRTPRHQVLSYTGGKFVKGVA
jgi:zinc D-Ala-D-Ala carboxypeptidase